MFKNIFTFIADFGERAAAVKMNKLLILAIAVLCLAALISSVQVTQIYPVIS